MKEFDLIVIGAGSGGLVAATTAQRLGLNTALIEKNKIGGECTHYGCVPSKALISSAKLHQSMKSASSYGLSSTAGAREVQFAEVMEHVDQIVQGIYRHETPEVFEKQGIAVYVEPSGARFLDQHQVRVGEEVLTFKHAIICTGSSPRLLEGDHHAVPFLDNENFWELRDQPGSIAFIGGGVIAAEIGQALARLGSEVTIIDRNPHILKVLDPDVREVLMQVLAEEGVSTITGATVQTISSRGDQAEIELEADGSPRKLLVDRVFLSGGRLPNTGGMDLEKAGVEYTSRGITTNDYLQTSAPHIYACGDVTTPLKFTHTASHQANICVANILAGNTRKNDLSVFPWAIFTEPEIAHVGMSEHEAWESLGNVSVFRVDASIDRFITEGKTKGFLKVIFDQNDQVVGADAIGAHAGEWIQLLTLIIKNKIPAQSVADTIFAYPTHSEIVKKAFTRFLRTKI